MARITYIDPSGAAHVYEVADGRSVMQGAIDNNVRGIIAECGGACSCATCHVYVDAAWVATVGVKSEAEESMLDAVCDPRPNSRLACQIEVSGRLDGLIVHMPAKQV